MTTLANGARIKVYPTTAYSAVFYCRWIERSDALFIRANALLAPTFVDVGAHCGLMSAQLFDKFSTFYLFEPASSSFRALEENCGLNPSVDCRPCNVAVSDRAGQFAFLDEGNFSGTSRLVDPAKVAGDKVRQVAADTLDNLLRDAVGTLVMKVDVEGAEERVFHGASSLFAAQRVRLVMFERLERTNLENVRKFMSGHDYVLFRVREDGTVTQDRRAIAEPLINLFACPSSVFPELVVGQQ